MCALQGSRSLPNEHSTAIVQGLSQVLASFLKMAFFGGGGGGLLSGSGGSNNPMKDFEFQQPPDDSISKIAFSPYAQTSNYLIASSWDNNVYCYEVGDNVSQKKAQTSHSAPVLDCCWHSDGTKVLTASCDKTCKLWDLQSNQAIDVAQHAAPIKCVQWVQSPSYNVVMTGSWDKTLKFWDMRSPNPVLSLALPERCYCMDVMYPMAIVGTASRGLVVYQLEGTPSEFKKVESPLKYQHRCVRIFKDRQNQPTGFALGSIEGRVAIHYINPQNPTKDNFTFKCHRNNATTGAPQQDIFPVNDIAFHPQHGTLSTVGSDGRFSFWDKDARTKLKTSEPMDLPITSCCFHNSGNVFAYSVSYDWSKGHEHFNPQKKNHIFMRNIAKGEEMKPRSKKR